MRLTAYLAVAAFAWWLNAGMLFAMAQSMWPKYAAQVRREDLGMSLFVGAMTAAVWPIGTPMIWCMTGFAEHGVWSKLK